MLTGESGGMGTQLFCKFEFFPNEVEKKFQTITNSHPLRWP